MPSPSAMVLYFSRDQETFTLTFAEGVAVPQILALLCCCRTMWSPMICGNLIFAVASVWVNVKAAETATATNENRCSLIIYSDSVGYLFDVRSMISRHILLLWYGHFQNPALSSSLLAVPSAFRLQNHSPETLSTMCSLMNL